VLLRECWRLRTAKLRTDWHSVTAVVKKIYGGYGEFKDPELCAKVPDVPCAGPDYKLYQDGNEYFDPNFPQMTKLIRASICMGLELTRALLMQHSHVSPPLLKLFGKSCGDV
jgi:hypothetical protein